MAWQLIYTSAPRLLEAGLTGLGTVARHRGIPPLVVKAVERISQFARLPGYDPARIIFSHRILTVGGSRFHVLSRLRDAGSDYSGRTNHIAHHVIAPAAEISQLGAAAVTPADVLLQMTWLDRWDRAPEWLEIAEEVPLPNIAPSPDADHAWAAVTGNPEHRWLLVNGPASKGCCLITPSHSRLLPLLAASQHCQTAAQSWQTGFTTALQPTDDLGDYRWMGVPADAPLRNVLESSGRPVLDLTNPGALPEPEVPHSATPAATRASRSSSPPPPAVGKYTPPPPPHALSGINNPPSVSDGRKHTPLGKRRNETEFSRSWLLALIVGVVVLAGIVAGWFYFEKSTGDAAARAMRELELRIEKAKTIDHIEQLKPGSAASSKLGKFIEDVKRYLSSKPKSFGDAVVELKMHQDLKGDHGIGRYVEHVIKILEQDARKHYEPVKASTSDFEGYEWIDDEVRNWAEAEMKKLKQQPTVNPGGLAGSASPVAKPTTERPPTTPTPPPEPKPEVIQPARITILKDWAALDSLILEPEWTEKMHVYLQNGPDHEVVKDKETNGRFRDKKRGILPDFQITKESQLKKMTDTKYRRLDLINSKDGSVWRVSISEWPELAKLKPSMTLKWNNSEACFELDAAEWQKLQVYRLADGQAWILECPFTVNNNQDKKKANWLEMPVSPVSAGKFPVSSEWIQGLLKEANENVEDTEKFKELMEKIVDEQKKKNNSISGLGPNQVDRDAKIRNYEDSYNTAVGKIKADQDKLKSDSEQRRKDAAAHPLKLASENSKLPPGPYTIFLKLTEDLKPTNLIKILERSE